MALPKNGFVQPVEVITGGSLPRNGFVQPVEVIGGAPSPATPVAGGSGQFYASITAALAGETQTVVSGLVPQAGTGPGVIVGPGTLSAVDNFYKDMFVLNTSVNPSNGLVSQWARVSSYVGATRTFTIDKPWDFSAEANFEVIDPVRIMVFLNLQEDVNVNKNLVLELGGNRLQGKIDISSADFCWIRGGSGYVTNGIQKTDFGLLKVNECTVSRRDATIYTLLLTNGSNLGRCELADCELMGRVSGRRGFIGWYIQNCKNYGVPDLLFDLPYTLVESIAGVAITLSAIDVGLDSQFNGAIVYSENSVTGATAYYSILGCIRSSPDFTGTKVTTKKLAFFMANGTATLNVTATSGGVIISPGDVDSNAESITGGLIQNWSVLEAVNFSGTASVTLSTGGAFRVTFTTASNGAAVEISGTTTMSGSVTLSGSDVITPVTTSGGSFIVLRLEIGISGIGSVTINGSGSITQSGGGNAVFVCAATAAMTAGTPSVSISKSYTIQNVGTIDRIFIISATVSVGTFTISSAIACGGYQFIVTPVALAAGVSGGTWLVSGTMAFAGLLPSDSALIFADHLGTGGTLTVSNVIFMGDYGVVFSTIAKATGAGASTTVSSATFSLRSGTVTSGVAVQAVTATSTASFTGIIRYYNCTFTNTFTILISTTAGSSATGPSTVLFDHCTFETTLLTESGTGTITWTGASITFRHCHIEGLFTIVATRFSSVQAYFTEFNGNSSNKAITATGSRPTTFRFWKCSFASRYDDLQPETLNEYDILPAQAALVIGQPVKINTANQYQVCVAASVVDGVLLAAAGGAGTISIAVRQGRVYVNVNPAVANGDNLVLDTVTPTRANTAAAAVVGQEIGTALEAAGATVAGAAYTAVNVR